MNKFNVPSDADNNLMAVVSEEERSNDHTRHLPSAEVMPDNALVEEAHAKLTDIFRSHYQNALQNALLEAGQYIIDTFYAGDIELARQKKPTKEQSYSELVELLNRQSEDAPKKSWLYNAVNLVIQEHDFSSFHALGKLKVAHKLLLLPIHDRELKKRLVEESERKSYSSRQLAQRIKETKNRRKKSLSSTIAKPAELFSPDNACLHSNEVLTEIKPKKLDEIKTKIKKQKKELISRITAQNQYVEQYETLLEKVDNVVLDNEGNPKKKRKVSGTEEWAEKNINCTTGCLNDCKYCYARYDAVGRYQRVKQGEWAKMIIRDHDVFKRHPKYRGTVMFPSTHDIVPENIYACLIVLENLLKVGNKVIIVSKPRLECIEKICENFKNYKKQILFRFTIGATDDKILKFWEQGAPEYEERKNCLEWAYRKKFETSVSAEPMLDSANIDKLIEELHPFTTDAIWIGKMNKINNRVATVDPETDPTVDTETQEALKAIEEGQTDERIQSIYERHKDNLKIKWKDSIKTVVGIEQAEKAGLDQ